MGWLPKCIYCMWLYIWRHLSPPPSPAHLVTHLNDTLLARARLRRQRTDARENYTAVGRAHHTQPVNHWKRECAVYALSLFFFKSDRFFQRREISFSDLMDHLPMRFLAAFTRRFLSSEWFWKALIKHLQKTARLSSEQREQDITLYFSMRDLV